MAKFRIDLLLKSDKQGASESYYCDDTDFAAASDRAVALATIRKALLNARALVQGHRVTPLDPKGLQSGKGKAKNREDSGVTGALGTTRDEEDVSLLVASRNSATGNIKRAWLRFLPDEYIAWDDAGVFTPDPAFAAAFTSYQNELQLGSYYVRTFNSATTGNPDYFTVETVATDSDGVVSFQVSPTPTSILPGKRVKVKGYIGPLGKQLNGMYRVLAVTGNIVSINAKSCDFKDYSGAPAGAQLFKEGYKFDVIDECEHEGASSRDTGRAFFVRRGRRSRRPRCLFTPAVA